MRPRTSLRDIVCCLTAFAAVVAPAFAQSPAEEGSGTLRVCADPNNLPFSDRNGKGFENKLAELVADDIGMAVSYKWWAQRRGFIRNTLKAGTCDVIMGVPALDMIGLTRSYFSSTYVLVSRVDKGYEFSSLQAPELRDLKIGVHLIGDDGANTPAVQVLGDLGIVENVVGYPIYGDYREDSPPLRVLKDVVDGKIDMAIVWGPLAGYFAKTTAAPLKVTPITGAEAFLPFVFQFSIAMGVRKDDQALQSKLNEVISRKRPEIEAILDEYGVPRL